MLYGGRLNVFENLLCRLRIVGSHVCDSLITRISPLHEGLRNGAFTNLHMWELLAPILVKHTYVTHSFLTTAQQMSPKANLALKPQACADKRLRCEVELLVATCSSGCEGGGGRFRKVG